VVSFGPVSCTNHNTTNAVLAQQCVLFDTLQIPAGIGSAQVTVNQTHQGPGTQGWDIWLNWYDASDTFLSRTSLGTTPMSTSAATVTASAAPNTSHRLQVELASALIPGASITGTASGQWDARVF
jgi:hypothetical protein